MFHVLHNEEVHMELFPQNYHSFHNGNINNAHCRIKFHLAGVICSMTRHEFGPVIYICVSMLKGMSGFDFHSLYFILSDSQVRLTGIISLCA